MTELLTSTVAVAAAAMTFVVVTIVLAIVYVRHEAARAGNAERRLSALYTEIEAVIGDRIDRSGGGRWREHVSAELKRLAAASAGAPRRREDGDSWIAIAGRALETALRSVQGLGPHSARGKNPLALGLAERLTASHESVAALAGSDDLETALVSGALNDVLTTAPLLVGYFAREGELAVVIEAYLLAAAALRLALAEIGIVLDIPAVLSIASSRDVRGEALDGRELRRIPQARTLANRIADRLVPGANLVVYCSVPGWTTREGRRPPDVVFWNSASWLV
jgi:hypothetical protein